MTSTEQPESAAGSRPTAFVLDTPADHDAFGPHQQLAEGLLAVIGNEPGGRTIGLVGEYGSGKSTVVRLLQRAANAAPNIRIWIFDAWAHDGDPLRRTFLESITHFLAGQDWIKLTNWLEALEELAMKRRTTKTTTRPKLAPLGVLLAFGLLLTPAGIVLLSAALRDGIALRGPLDEGRLLLGLIGGFLALAPAGIASFAAIQMKRRYKTWRQAAEELASIVVQRGEQDLQAHSIETPDPTTLEFEAYFAKLMAEALDDKDRQLVLVVDNLDRIEPLHATRIWSTLRTFVEHNSQSVTAAWLPQLWVIVPHDAHGIRRSWKGDSQTADSMLDKSIQIRFDVPLPLLPDWKRYTMELLATALPEDKDAHHSLYRLIAVVKPFPGHAPTPRILKSVVNAVAALRLQSGSEIPLTHLGYYALLRMKEAHRSGAAILDQLLTGALPGEAEASLLPAGVGESLAAMVFGVDVARAGHLLLSPSVDSALSNGDGPALAALADRFPDAFPVVESVLHNATADWQPEEPAKILNALHALEESGLLDAAPPHEAAALRTSLLRALSAADSLLPTGVALRGLEAMLHWAGESAVAEELFEKILSGLRAHLAAEDLSKWAESYSGSTAVFNDCGYPQLAGRQVMLPADYPRFHNAIAALLTRGVDRAVLERFGSTERPTELTSGVMKVLAKPEGFTWSHAEALGALAKNCPQIDIKGIAAALAGKLHAQAGVGIDLIDAFIYCLQRLGQLGDDQIKQLGADGHLAHLLHVVSGDDITIRARVVAAYLQAIPDLSMGTRAGQAVHGHQWLQQQLRNPDKGLPEAVASVLIEDSDPTHAFTSFERAGSDAVLLADILSVIAASQEYDEFFSPDFLERHWVTLGSRIADPAFLERIADANFCTAVRRGTFKLDSGVFYAAVLAANNDADLAEWIYEGLADVQEAVWLDQLRSNASPGCKLASALAPFKQKRLGQPLRSALRSHATAVAEGATPNACLSFLLELLEPNHRSVFRAEVAMVLKEKAGQARGPFFESFGAELNDASQLNRDSSVATGVFENIVTAQYLPGLRWMAEWTEAQDRPFEGLGVEHINIIKDAVRDRYTTSTEETEEGRLLKRIAKALKVRKKAVRR